MQRRSLRCCRTITLQSQEQRQLTVPSRDRRGRKVVEGIDLCGTSCSLLFLCFVSSLGNQNPSCTAVLLSCGSSIRQQSRHHLGCFSFLSYSHYCRLQAVPQAISLVGFNHMGLSGNGKGLTRWGSWMNTCGGRRVRKILLNTI